MSSSAWLTSHVSSTGASGTTASLKMIDTKIEAE